MSPLSPFALAYGRLVAAYRAGPKGAAEATALLMEVVALVSAEPAVVEAGLFLSGEYDITNLRSHLLRRQVDDDEPVHPVLLYDAVHDHDEGSCGPADLHAAASEDRDGEARHDRRRPTARQRGYNREWQKARAAYLAEHPNCVRCFKAASVVDHIKPHRGDDTLFWDRSNWQALCATCHNRHKQREERRQVLP